LLDVLNAHLFFGWRKIYEALLEFDQAVSSISFFDVSFFFFSLLRFHDRVFVIVEHFPLRIFCTKDFAKSSSVEGMIFCSNLLSCPV
jgi:hypothetical protein